MAFDEHHAITYVAGYLATILCFERRTFREGTQPCQPNSTQSVSAISVTHFRDDGDIELINSDKLAARCFSKCSKTAVCSRWSWSA